MVICRAQRLVICRSPFKIEVEDPQKDLIDVAVKGSLNLLSSVAKAGQGVQRVVLTSSVAGEHWSYQSCAKVATLLSAAMSESLH